MDPISYNIISEVKERAMPILRQKTEDLAEDMITLWDYELVQESTMGYASAMECLKDYMTLSPKIQEAPNGEGYKLSMEFSCDDGHRLHPGLDTLLEIIQDNLSIKSKYERR